MDELKLLIEMVANLPTLAVWVLVGYLAYKVAVVGSIYGVLRLMIVKFHDWLTMPPHPIKFEAGSKCISEAVATELRGEIGRLGNGAYIHSSDVEKLRRAIDSILQPPKKP